MAKKRLRKKAPAKKRAAASRKKTAAAPRKKVRGAVKKKQASKRKNTAKKRTVKKGVAKKRTVKKGVAKKRTAKKRTAKKRTAKKRTAKKGTAKKRTAASRKKTATAPRKKARSAVKKKRTLKKKGATKKRTAKKKVSAVKKRKTALKKEKTAKKKPAVKRTIRKPAAKARKPVKARPQAKPPPRARARMIKPGENLMALKAVKAYQLQKGETYMSPQQMDHFSALLLNWKRELMQEVDRTVNHMQSDATNFADPADRATQEEEFSLELRTRDRERKLIKKIDEALGMIEMNEYGYCNSCGAEIGVRRLEARPTATLCIDCKTMQELKEKQLAD